MTVKENRCYFRVSGLVGLHVSPLSDAQWQAEERAIGSDWAPPRTASEENELTHWLDRVEQKLDLLLDHLEIPNPCRALRTKPQEVVISGGGLSYQSAQPFDAGQRVVIELEIGLPTVWIRCLGSVIRSEPEERGFKVALRFDVIREADRDRIIKYALENERRRVRRERAAGT